MGLCANVCRATMDCQGGMNCESTLVDEELNAFVKLCVVSNILPINGGEAGAASEAGDAADNGTAGDAGASGEAGDAAAGRE